VLKLSFIDFSQRAWLIWLRANRTATWEHLIAGQVHILKTTSHRIGHEEVSWQDAVNLYQVPTQNWSFRGAPPGRVLIPIRYIHAVEWRKEAQALTSTEDVPVTEEYQVAADLYDFLYIQKEASVHEAKTRATSATACAAWIQQKKQQLAIEAAKKSPILTGGLRDIEDLFLEDRLPLCMQNIMIHLTTKPNETMHYQERMAFTGFLLQMPSTKPEDVKNFMFQKWKEFEKKHHREILASRKPSGMCMVGVAQGIDATGSSARLR
jgi:hypothetical protein